MGLLGRRNSVTRGCTDGGARAEAGDARMVADGGAEDAVATEKNQQEVSRIRAVACTSLACWERWD
jgi:hypothetical protein